MRKVGVGEHSVLVFGAQKLIETIRRPMECDCDKFTWLARLGFWGAALCESSAGIYSQVD
jgi:hypothetical protein